MISGCIIGAVSICGGVDQYYPWAACVIAGTIHQSINNMIDC